MGWDVHRIEGCKGVEGMDLGPSEAADRCNFCKFGPTYIDNTRIRFLLPFRFVSWVLSFTMATCLHFISSCRSSDTTLYCSDICTAMLGYNTTNLIHPPPIYHPYSSTSSFHPV
jgi:hypothetical protein